MGSARCVANGTFHLALPLREYGERRGEEQNWQSGLHESEPKFILSGFGDEWRGEGELNPHGAAEDIFPLRFQAWHVNTG
jgi:hypothetical protein